MATDSSSSGFAATDRPDTGAGRAAAKTPVVRVLNLDGAGRSQRRIFEHYRATTIPAQDWGPRIRIGAGFRRFREFCEAMAAPQEEWDHRPNIVLLGSGDFHHVTLALLGRLAEPMNLLVLDAHPDWMRGVPFMHCGTWLLHAARLGQVVRVFHVGGDVDFDNMYHRLAPWPLLASGKIQVLPAVRRFRRGRWRHIDHQPLRDAPDKPADAERIAERIAPWREELARRPLYITVDKDVLTADEAAVNWDSGLLTLDEVTAVVRGCLEAAAGRLVGADLLGDWSPVQTQGVIATLLDRARLGVRQVDPRQATACNEEANMRLVECILAGARHAAERLTPASERSAPPASATSSPSCARPVDSPPGPCGRSPDPQEAGPAR